MKIITPGRGTGESRQFEITCGACRCGFLFQENETSPKIIRKDYDGIWSDATIKVVDCPECGKEVNAFPNTFF